MTHDSGISIGTPAGETGIESLRGQIEQTRLALAGRAHSLKLRMIGSVDTACDALDETVQTARKTALNAVQAIKCTLDLKQQAARHPWAMMGVATFIGALLGKRNQDRPPAAPHKSSGELNGRGTSRESAASETVATGAQTLGQPPHMTQWLRDRIKLELGKFHDEAISTGARLIRDCMERLAQAPTNASSNKQAL